MLFSFIDTTSKQGATPISLSQCPRSLPEHSSPDAPMFTKKREHSPSPKRSFPFSTPSPPIHHKPKRLPAHHTMKLPPAIHLLTLLTLTAAIPQTIYTTHTITPLSTRTAPSRWPTYANTSTTITIDLVPTGTRFPNLARYQNATNVSLSRTLSYPTTDIPPPPIIFLARPCIPDTIHCHRPTGPFSFCAPLARGGSRLLDMGPVPSGTVCVGGEVRAAECAPVGGLKCRGERGFFVCDRGMFSVWRL